MKNKCNLKILTHKNNMIVEIIDASIMNAAGSLGQLGPSIGSVYLVKYCDRLFERTRKMS